MEEFSVIFRFDTVCFRKRTLKYKERTGKKPYCSASQPTYPWLKWYQILVRHRGIKHDNYTPLNNSNMTSPISSHLIVSIQTEPASISDLKRFFLYFISRLIYISLKSPSYRKWFCIVYHCSISSAKLINTIYILELVWMILFCKSDVFESTTVSYYNIIYWQSTQKYYWRPPSPKARNGSYRNHPNSACA